jgi:hypothetical protein
MERSEGRPTSGVGGCGSERGRLLARLGRRDAWLGRLCLQGGRRNEQPERLESKGERTSSRRRCRMISAAAVGARARRLHESADRLCKGVERRKARVGRPMGTAKEALVEPCGALVEPRDALVKRCGALVEPWEVPRRAREALRSRGADSPGVSRPQRRGAGAHARPREARSRGGEARGGGRSALRRRKGRPTQAESADRRIREARQKRSGSPGGRRAARLAPRASGDAAWEDPAGADESRTEGRADPSALRRPSLQTEGVIG